MQPCKPGLHNQSAAFRKEDNNADAATFRRCQKYCLYRMPLISLETIDGNAFALKQCSDITSCHLYTYLRNNGVVDIEKADKKKALTLFVQVQLVSNVLL